MSLKAVLSSKFWFILINLCIQRNETGFKQAGFIARAADLLTIQRWNVLRTFRSFTATTAIPQSYLSSNLFPVSECWMSPWVWGPMQKHFSRRLAQQDSCTV